MQMIGHDHEFVQEIFLLFQVAVKNVHHQFGGSLLAKQRRALPSHGRHEKCSINIHSEIVRLDSLIARDFVTMDG